MDAGDIQLLYAYACWATARILDAAAQLPAEQFATARLGYCELRATLAHMFSAERRWRARWQGEPNTAMLRAEDIASLQMLREAWAAEQEQMRAYLVGTLRDADLAQEFTYTRPNGTQISSPRWQTMAHMINHGTQHRSELAMLLTELGHSPGNLDMNIFLTEQASAGKGRL